jgi:hypothetical protein
MDGDSPKSGNSIGQAVVSINKPLQTEKNNLNIDKQENHKNSSFQSQKNGIKQKTTVPYRDNLKTGREKDYNEPL